MSGRRTQTSPASSRPTTPRPDSDAYFTLSTRPLHILIFLLPLILLYELGSALYLTNVEAGTRKTIEAQVLLNDFFEAFGVAGLFVPGLALGTVMLCWHILSRDSWRIRPGIIAGMFAESLAWTLPLIVLSAAHSRAAKLVHPLAALQGPTPTTAASWQENLTISIGAGLYEEMLFRLVGIALLHFILRDLIGLKHLAASACAVLLAAVAFALYHRPLLPTGGLDWTLTLFYILAGAYLGAIYVLRGFGIAVACHAFYDILVLVLLSGSRTTP